MNKAFSCAGLLLAAAIIACARDQGRTGVSPVPLGVSPGENLEPPQKPSPPQRKLYKLTAEDYWRIELPDDRRFDASGLAFDNDRLLIVANGTTTLYELPLATNHVASPKPVPAFTSQDLRAFTSGKGGFDFEGIARDEQGRLYIAEESHRLIVRWDPAGKKLNHLQIDWTPVKQYFSSHDNASFEGIAVGGGKLWLANERDRARVIEVDLETLKITGHFAPQPADPGLFLHYSDLCFYKGRLYLLLRHQQAILEIDPATRDVLAEYDFQAVENAPEHEYRKIYPTGVMEGLTVDDNYFWLLTDNNGFPRIHDPRDRRPTLFKCPRPRP